MNGPWIEWEGGEDPIQGKNPVRVRLRNGFVSAFFVDPFIRWHHRADSGDVMAYQLEVAPQTESKPMLLSADPVERKGIPITTGVLDYFPLAIAYVAKVSKAGNDQHNPGQALHWAKGKSMDHADCIARHLIDRGSFDSDGFRHSGKLAWRALAALQIELEAEAQAAP